LTLFHNADSHPPDPEAIEFFRDPTMCILKGEERFEAQANMGTAL